MFNRALRKAVFLDRDGVVNHLVDRGDTFMVGGKPCRYTAPWVLAELRLCPDVRPALELMWAKDYLPILVTNQPDLATGNMRLQDFAAIVQAMQELPFAAMYACKHHPKAGCACRKPAPGMLFTAATALELDPKGSYMVGDMETDILAGKVFGARTIRVTTEDVQTAADHRVRSIMEAARLLP